MKKFSRLIAFVFLGITLSVAFQNCGKTNFAAVEGSSLDLTSLDLKTLKIEGVEAGSEGAPVKIFVIMDFSPTMQQEIETVKSALNAFLNATKSKYDFTLSVISIDPNDVDVVKNVSIANGTRVDLKDPIATITASKSMSLASFESLKTAFNLKVANFAAAKLLQNIDVYESGLCQMVRIMKSGLVNPNDTVSFYIISDENDSSSSQCLEQTTTAPFDYLDIYASQKYITTKITVSGVRKRWIYEVRAKVDPSCVDIPYTGEGGPPAYVCPTYVVTPGYYVDDTITNEVQNHLQGYCHEFQLPGFSLNCDTPVTTETACGAQLVQAIKNNPGSYGLDSISGEPLCSYAVGIANGYHWRRIGEDRTSKSIREIVDHQDREVKIDGTNYSSIQAYSQAHLPAGSQFVYSLLPHSTSTAKKHIEFLNGGTFASKFKDLASSKLLGHNSVAATTVVYGTDANCGASGPYASNGVEYINFIDQMTSITSSTLFKKVGICQSNYEAVLANSAVLATWSPTMSYNVSFYRANFTSKVEIVDAQENVVELQKGVHFLIEGPTGQTIKFTPAAVPFLKKGSTVRFHWPKP